MRKTYFNFKINLIVVGFFFSAILFLPKTTMWAAERVFTVFPKPVNGTITSLGWLNCGDAGDVCLANITFDPTAINSIELIPRSSTNHYFFSWLGDCTGTSQCTLGFEMDHTVSAVFKLMALFTIKSPPAHGTINHFRQGFVNDVVWFPEGGPCRSTTSTVAGSCSQYYYPGTPEGFNVPIIKFTATPDMGYVFQGWTDDCSTSGTADCVLKMSQDRIIGANFQLNPTLSSSNIPLDCVDVDGNGLINEIDCGDVRNTNCSASLCGSANPVNPVSVNPPADIPPDPVDPLGNLPPGSVTTVATSPFSWQITNPFAGGVDSVMGLLAVLANFIFQLGIPVAVIIIIYSGVTYLTAGNTERVKRATDGLKWSALGLAILLIGKGFVALIQSILSIK